MTKISKFALNNHQKAMDLVELERDLTISEKEFILENFLEEAVVNINWSGAYFTGADLAWEFGLCVTDNPDNIDDRETVVDLCAGIGSLGFHLLQRFEHIDLICVEMNEDFVKVGRKLLPNAKWICGSVSDPDVIDELLNLNICTAISNPPFGSVTSMRSIPGNHYKGAQAAFKIAELALRVAKRATFILPNNCCPFMYSGQNTYKEVDNSAYTQFSKQTGIDMTVSCLDTVLLGEECDQKNHFRNTNITVEVVHLHRGARWHELNQEPQEPLQIAMDLAS